MINPVQDITPDGRPVEGTAYLEHLTPGASLDSGLRAGMSSSEPLQQSVRYTSLVARPHIEIRMPDCKPVINPVQDITPDGRPMEGTTYPEHLALGVSLDSGPDATDRPEHSTLASQMHHKQSCSKSSARPMPDPDLNVYTDVNKNINTDLPESTAPMINSQRDHKRSYFNPSARPMLDPDVVIHTDVNVDIDADLPEDSAHMMKSDLIVLELDDAT